MNHHEKMFIVSRLSIFFLKNEGFHFLPACCGVRPFGHIFISSVVIRRYKKIGHGKQLVFSEFKLVFLPVILMSSLEILLKEEMGRINHKNR